MPTTWFQSSPWKANLKRASFWWCLPHQKVMEWSRGPFGDSRLRNPLLSTLIVGKDGTGGKEPAAKCLMSTGSAPLFVDLVRSPGLQLFESERARSGWVLWIKRKPNGTKPIVGPSNLGVFFGEKSNLFVCATFGTHPFETHSLRSKTLEETPRG